ncbi:head morphogenesis [Ralstonia phage PQ43W]
MTELRTPGKRDKTLPPITPNTQTERKYRKALEKAIANMVTSYDWWIAGKYRKAVDANEKLLAQDASVGQQAKRRTDDLYGELTRLRKYWGDYFEKFAQALAQQAVEDWYKDNATAWQGKLKRAGFDIQMQLTTPQKIVLRAKVHENVALIRSIQQDYHKDVEGIVSRSFLAGRDLSTMAEEIKKRGNVSTGRAALIARDQSNKATAQMNAARQAELGLTRAVWVHSSAGKEPRPKHVTAGRERWEFDTQVGIDFGDGMGFVRPGEAINCRCISRTLIPAIGRDRGPDSTMSVEKSRVGARGVFARYTDGDAANPFKP